LAQACRIRLSGKNLAVKCDPWVALQSLEFLPRSVEHRPVRFLHRALVAETATHRRSVEARGTGATVGGVHVCVVLSLEAMQELSEFKLLRRAARHAVAMRVQNARLVLVAFAVGVPAAVRTIADKREEREIHDVIDARQRKHMQQIAREINAIWSPSDAIPIELELCRTAGRFQS